MGDVWLLGALLWVEGLAQPCKRHSWEQSQRSHRWMDHCLGLAGDVGEGGCQGTLGH